MSENQFVVIDKFGYTIICTRERWQHIISGHEYLGNREDDVAETIAEPKEGVYRSKPNPACYVACRSNGGEGKPYLKAVVRCNPSQSSGIVITAYAAQQIGGENIDTSARLYPKGDL